MEPIGRTVLNFPLTELWDSEGSVIAERVGEIDEAGIRRALAQGPVVFVVAEVGAPLRWLSAEDRFTFWKAEAKQHLVPIDERKSFSVFDYPEGFAYVASEWERSDGVPIVLLESHR